MDYASLSKKINWQLINNRELVIVDLETTGFDKKEDTILEIGAVRLKPNTDLETFSVLIQTDVQIPEEITELTGIDNELIDREGVPFYRAIGDFKTFLGSSEASAYNAKFDKGFLDEFCKKYNIPFKTYFSDTMLLCRKAFKLSGMKLKDVAEHLNLPYDGAHRAIFDSELGLICHMHALIELEKNN